MDKLKFQSLNKELEKLENFSGIIGSAIVNRNGLLISSRLPRYIDERKFATMSAIIYESIESVVSTLNENQIAHLTVEFNEFQLIIVEVDTSSIFVSLMDLKVNYGLILIEIEETIKNLKNNANKTS